MIEPVKNALPMSSTCIEALLKIPNRGLLTELTTLWCGSTGSGKTVLRMEFLIHGILDYGG